MSSGPLPTTPGDRLLDRYRIDAAFSGGMGILWTVTDEHSGRRYAIKTVRQEYRGDAHVLQRFMEEARTWIALDRHEHLVQALWLIEHPTGPYLVLERVDGSDLAGVLAQGPLPLERALDLAMQFASGMAYAHTRPLSQGVGVLHRDLKPSNLLVAAGDLLKVTDFGLARVLRAVVRPGEEGVGVGTPAYMAPEQLRGSRDVDGRADIYSFGLVLTEMLTGANPLAGGTLAEQVARVLDVVPPTLEEAPDTLAALVARCVAKDPALRPRDFGEVLGHLAQIARDEGLGGRIDATTIPPPGRPTGLACDPPVLRPRRPRRGEPFRVELRLRGDVGPGPVELHWDLPPLPGLELLGTRSGPALRVEAGGSTNLVLRAHLQAGSAGKLAVPESTIALRGPAGESAIPVPAFGIAVADALLLPLADREEEMTAIRQVVARLESGEPAAHLFVGGIGMGKTRLLREAERLAVQAGLRVVHGRGHGNRSRPMRVLHDLARHLCDLPPGEPRGVRAAVNRLLGDEPAAARYFAEVLAGGTVLETGAPITQHWIVLLRVAARRGPHLFLLDDLQNAAVTAVDLLAQLIARTLEERLPLGWIATLGVREVQAPARRRLALLQAASGEKELVPRTLAPLDRAAIDGLVGAVFPGHGFAEEAPWLMPTLAAVTAGNPFHLAEILRLLTTGSEASIRRIDDEWRIDAGFSPEQLRELVPDALEDAVRQRLDALSPGARDVLSFAALVGAEFDVDVLDRAVGDAARVDAALGEMEGADVVRAVTGEVDRYRFWSAIVPTVVRRGIEAQGEAVARPLHRAVAAAMLKTYGGERRQRRALSIAEHLRLAGDPAASLPFTLEGCERLLSLQLPERARRLLAPAQALAEAEGVSPALASSFAYLYGIACEATGEYDAGLEALTRFVESPGASGGDSRRLPRAYSRLGRIHQARGEYDRARYCFGVASQLLEDVGDLHAVAFLQGNMAELAFDQGQLHTARGHLLSAETIAARVGNEGALVRAAVLRGRLALDLGMPAEAKAAFLDAERRARELHDRPRLAASLLGLGRTALETGYLGEARSWLEQARDLFALMGDKAGLANALLHSGRVQEGRGRVDRALAGYRRSERIFRELGHPEGVATARLHAGRVLRAWGRTTHAVEDLAAASEELQRLGLPERILALRELGYALADAGSERAARVALARADRADPRTSERRRTRAISTAVRSALALADDDLDRAWRYAQRATRRAARTPGHEARVVASVQRAEVALRLGDLGEARRAAEMVLAFGQEREDPRHTAAAERILMEIAARAGRLDEARARAHRAARAYTRRADSGDGPARLLLALGRGLRHVRPGRARRYLDAARRCYARLEAQGFRPPAEAQTAFGTDR